MFHSAVQKIIDRYIFFVCKISNVSSLNNKINYGYDIYIIIGVFLKAFTIPMNLY